MVANDKLNYVIDGNFFLFKTLSVTGVFDEKYPRFIKGDDEVKREEDKNVLLGKLTMDLCADIRKSASLIEDLIITYDDYSWRNDFFQENAYKFATNIPEESQSDATAEIDYKGTRKKDKEVDWSAIYDTFEMFLKDVESIANVKWLRVSGCEGDDLVFGISAYYNAIGKNVMIYSGDNDLKQLISHNSTTNAFTIHHKKTESKIVMHPLTARWLSENKSVIRGKLNAFRNNNDIKLSAELPYEILFDKIFCGDKGDNVLSIMEEPRKYKSGKKKGQWKTVRMTPSIVKKVKEEIEHNNYSVADFFNDTFISTLANSAHRNFKPTLQFPVEHIINNIKINRDLMMLHKRCLPHSIYESMMNEIEKLPEVVNLKLNELYSYKILQEKMPNYTKKETDGATSASIFKNLGL